MFRTVRHAVTFDATPQEIYEMLMDSQKHAKFTGAPANFSQDVGGDFTCYGDELEGVNLELVPGRRIVQSWRHKQWPENHYSTVTYELEELTNGTELRLTQTGVPEPAYSEINQGWGMMYWDKMEAQLK